MDLRHNPFYVLGASLTDNKRRIMELAEEKSLFGDEEAIEEAKTILLDPIRRIDAEIAWFPELDVETARAMVLHLVEGQLVPSCRLDGVGRITERAETMYRTQYEDCSNKTEFANDILALARGFRDLDYDALQDILNRSRKAAGFSEITDEYLIADKIDNRRLEIIEIIQQRMDSLSIEKLLRNLYLIARYDTDDGKLQASILVEDIIRFYENNMMTQEFMENETNAIRGLLDSIKQAVSKNDQNFTYALNLAKALTGELQKWQNAVSPMQIIAASHGKEHRISCDLLRSIRDISIELNNEFNKPELSMKLMEAVGRTAADKHIPSIRKMRDKDSTALQKIMDDSAKEQREQREYEESIFYSNELGPFNEKFQISTKGIEWRGHIIPLNDINGVSWGTIRTSMNGFNLRTDCKIAFQSSNGIEQLSPNYQTYNEITERLWKAVALPIYVRMIKKIKNGETLSVGGIKFNDEGVYLIKSGWFSSEERFFPWNESFTIYNGNGTFVIKKKGEECSASSSYIDDMNTHIFEFAIRQFFKHFDRSNPRLSSQIAHEK